MDARNNPPALLGWELITPGNFDDHLPTIEHALGLNSETLQALFSDSAAAALGNDFDIQASDLDGQINKSIDSCFAENVGDDALTVRFLKERHQRCKDQQKAIAAHLHHKKNEILAYFNAATDSLKQQITNAQDCHLGNYAIKLEVLKRNIAITLQQAAYTLHQQWPDLREHPEPFNAVFNGIAAISADKKLILDATAADQFAVLTLAELQTKLTKLHEAATAHPNPMVIRYIRPALENLNHQRATILKNGSSLLMLGNHDIAITPVAFEIEKLASAASQSATTGMKRLERIEEAKLNEFEHDPKKISLIFQLSNSIKKLPDDVTTLRNINSRIEDTKVMIENARKTTLQTLIKAERINKYKPIDSRADTRRLLREANLNLPPKHQELIVNGLQDLLSDSHQRFIRDTNLDFLINHGVGLLDQYNNQGAELNSILDDAFAAESPLRLPTERFKAVAASLNNLGLSHERLDTTLTNVESERKKINTTFEQQRLDFLNLLTETLKNYWHEDFEQRLGATLLDIDDLIKKHTTQPLFPHTNLDKTFVELLSDYRAKTLATQQTLAPDFNPRSEDAANREQAPTAKQQIWRRAALFGTIGLLLGTLAAAIIVITGGLALLPIALGVLGAGMVAGAITGGVVGKVHVKRQQQILADNDEEVSATKGKRSSSTRIISRTGGLHLSRSDKSAYELTDDDLDYSEDEVERITDYSKTGGLVADGSTEYVPAHLRRT